MRRVTVVIVDDHPLFRAGVALSLSELGFEVAGQGSTADHAVQLGQQLRPDILLLDISIPGGGLEALNLILASQPEQKVVMLTVSEAGGDVRRALQGGAQGYVLKGVEAEKLSEILLSVASGEPYVPPGLSARLLARGAGARPTNLNGMDDRQVRIIELVSAGWSNKEIAIELGLQEKTIKHQLTRIFAALDVTNRTEAAMAFRDNREELTGARGS